MGALVPGPMPILQSAGPAYHALTLNTATGRNASLSSSIVEQAAPPLTSL